ncbi:MAG: ADP-ribose pyrophosphatase YjhB (NUDIX family) [Cocleimonas sp.]|jgi:ADP-ribose pyrophosphatase YjhB (NUDIX family)
MNFCNQCGKKVTQQIPENDNRLRFVCSSCDFIHYQNPNIVAGVLPLIVDNDGIEKVLMCRRAIEPRHGFWTLPAGFMENEESLEEAAARESIEEANLKLGKLRLYMVTSLPYINQVYMMYIGQAENDFSPGIESLETELFIQEEIPWDQLAFPVVKDTLENYFSDRARIRIKNTELESTEKLSISELDNFPVHTTFIKR